MELDLSRRVNLAVRGWIGAAIIFEKQEDDEGVPVRILRGPEAARRWIDGHYDGVGWDSPNRASALVGRLSEPAGLSPSASTSRAGEDRPLTYETDELRAYLPELVAGANGPVILQQCEEYVAESNRWEPFVSVLWESTW